MKGSTRALSLYQKRYPMEAAKFRAHIYVWHTCRRLAERRRRRFGDRRGARPTAGFAIHALSFRYGQRHACAMDAARRVAIF